MKKGKFYIPIYEVNLQIIIVPNKFETTKFYHSLIKKLKQPSEGDHPCEGFAFLHGLKGWLVLAEDKLSHSLISHEIFHITCKIIKFNNIDVNDSEESAALLIGFITDRVYKTINKLQIKIG